MGGFLRLPQLVDRRGRTRVQVCLPLSSPLGCQSCALSTFAFAYTFFHKKYKKIVFDINTNVNWAVYLHLFSSDFKTKHFHGPLTQGESR